MDPKRIVALVVGAAVMVLIFSALLVPIINDATTTEKTFTNEGYYYMDEINTSTSKTVTWDYTNPTVITVDNVEVELPQSTTFPATLICSDEWGLRYLPQSNDAVLTLFDNAKSTQFNASVQSTTNMTVTISGGTATFTNGTDTQAETFTTGYCIADAGNYVMKKSTDTVYLNGDSVIYSTGRTGGLSSLQASTVSIHVEGNIDDGVTATSLWPDTYTTSEVTLNYTEVNSYLDLYSFTSAQFTVTDTSSNTATATYSQVIVPASVTAELAVHPDAPTLTLLSVIPIFVMIGIVLAVVGVAFASRNDY